MKYLFILIVFLFFAFPSSGQNQVDINQVNNDYLDLIRKMKDDIENLKDKNENLTRRLESLTSNQKSIAQVKAEMAQEKEEKAAIPEGRSTEDILSELDQKEAELEELVREKRAVERGKEAAEKKNTTLNKQVKQSERDRVAAELEAEQNKNFLYGLAMATMFIFFLAALFYNRFRVNKKQKNSLQEINRQIEEERKRSDELLLNILPGPIANELKKSGKASAQKYKNVTVLFTDFKDFTKVSEKLTPEQLVRELDYCFRGFDFIISQYGVEKIKTIGDAYMCASGLTNKRTMPVNIIKAALEMQEFLEDYKKERMVKGLPFFEARIGIHTGPVVAGVVGVKKFAYDIWGDTVNIAARMEANAGVGKVNISEETYRQVKYNFECRHRGKIEAKNKGYIDMYHVEQPIAVAN